jgi:nucleotide-binding universal stress UspA family protein
MMRDNPADRRRAAMYHNMLVHIPTERSARPAVDGSISFAMTCGAHLDAIATGYERTGNVPYLMEGGAAVASMADIEQEQAMKRAEAAISMFDIEARNSGIGYSSRALSGSYGDVAAMVSAAARLYDITVVSQAEPDQGGPDNQLPQQLLLQTGGPLLIIPYTFKGSLAVKRIGICWDGSRLAARAMHDAMPLIVQADALTAITLNASDIPEQASTTEFANHMARRGLPVRTISFEADRGRIQSSILSIAADEGLDLLVMGGYGHSRVQETVFGGVTRDTLRSMTVPVLMSH